MFTLNETEKHMRNIDKLINEYAKQNNINIKRNGAKYGEDITTKLTITKNVETKFGTFPATKESRDYTFHCKYNDLPCELLFEEISLTTGENIRIMGYSTRKRKYPVIYKKDGKNYKCSVAHMLTMLKTSNTQYGV